MHAFHSGFIVFRNNTKKEKPVSKCARVKQLYPQHKEFFDVRTFACLLQSFGEVDVPVKQFGAVESTVPRGEQLLWQESFKAHASIRMESQGENPGCRTVLSLEEEQRKKVTPEQVPLQGGQKHQRAPLFSRIWRHFHNWSNSVSRWDSKE